jgi:hypothetical protein
MCFGPAAAGWARSFDRAFDGQEEPAELKEVWAKSFQDVEQKATTM